MTIAPLRIGIIGAGVSGIASAWLLQHDHQVTLLEKASALGGHAETLPVVVGNATVYAEYGPRFFFNPSYPYFLGLLRLLKVPTRWNDALVSITNVPRAHTVVLPPRSPRHVASLLRSPRLVRHLLSLRRLIKEQPAVFVRRDFSVPFHRYLSEGHYPAAFGPEFAYPFLAACWGAPIDKIIDFPAYSLLKGMPPGDKAGFFEIEGGTARYMRAFGEELTRVDVRLGAGVRVIERERDKTFVVEDERGERRCFDRLIVATNSRDAAELLRGVPGVAEMQAAIGGFRHFETEIAIHGDPAFMPPRRGDWAHHNFFFDRDSAWMSDWQGLVDDVPVIRTWLPKGRLPSPLHGRRTFHHLLMTPENGVLQRRIAALQGAAGLWVTGMYAVDVDNHESALLSALVPVNALAPEAPNLARLLGAVAPDAAHGLDVLPEPLGSSGRDAGGSGSSAEDGRSVPAADEPTA
jgi:uncharacterized protein